MANLGKFWVNVKNIDKARLQTLKSGAVGFNASFAINDEIDQYGNNVSVWMDQTEDERKSKGVIAKAEAEPVKAEVEADTDPDLPF